MSWTSLDRRVVRCKKCPRLITHCQEVAQTKRRAYLDFDYWGKPVPNFVGDKPQLLIVGLAPGAHGANRTGRMFTGDRSGEWLYRALYKADFANQPGSTNRHDGLSLNRCAITNICHCAPPQNKPTVDEIANCRDHLVSTIRLASPKVILALGKIAWDQILRLAREFQWYEGKKPPFHHGAEHRFENGTFLLASYHPSQQNTFTGRLTEPMLDKIMVRAKSIIGNK